MNYIVQINQLKRELIAFFHHGWHLQSIA
jgi:hypothetical protein